jgi:hypothetical protein
MNAFSVRPSKDDSASGKKINSHQKGVMSGIGLTKMRLNRQFAVNVLLNPNDL